MPTPKEIRKQEHMTKKQKRKQIYKMIFAALLVGAIFILGYVLIFVIGMLLL